MNNSYRHLFLEYLAEIKNLPLSEFTLVVLGNDEKTSLSSYVYNPQAVHVFSCKLPRIFYKNYDFALLEDTFIAEVLTIKDRVSFYHDQLLTQREPFGFKPLSTVTYYRLLVVPVFKDDDLLALALYYFSEETSDTVIKVTRIGKLLSQIFEMGSLSYISEMKNRFLKSYWVLDTNIGVFLSEELQQLINTDVTKDNLAQIIKEHQLQIVQNEKFHEHNLYVIAPKKESRQILAKEAIKRREITDQLTVLYFGYIGFETLDFSTIYEDVLVKSEKMVKRYRQSYYQINDNSLAIVIDGYLDKRIVERFKEKNTDYQVIVVRGREDVPLKGDLSMLFDFLAECEDEYFVKEHYQFYRDKLNEYQYKKALIESISQKVLCRKIFNSKDHEFIGHFLSLPSYTYGKTNRQVLNQACFQKIGQLLMQETITQPFVCIDVTSLTKRHTWEQLKKIRRLNINMTIILTNFKISAEVLHKYIDRFKLLDISFYFSSDIFNDITLSSLVVFSNGLYFGADELTTMIKYNHAFFKEITNFYVNNGVKLLLEVNHRLMTRFEHSKIDIITD